VRQMAHSDCSKVLMRAPGSINMAGPGLIMPDDPRKPTREDALTAASGSGEVLVDFRFLDEPQQKPC
jgi:hypothetical protein